MLKPKAQLKQFHLKSLLPSFVMSDHECAGYILKSASPISTDSCLVRSCCAHTKFLSLAWTPTPRALHPLPLSQQLLTEKAGPLTRTATVIAAAAVAAVGVAQAVKMRLCPLPPSWPSLTLTHHHYHKQRQQRHIQDRKSVV